MLNEAAVNFALAAYCIAKQQQKPQFINPLREIGFVYVPKARAVLIIATSVCRYLRVSKHSHGCQCLAMSMSARLLMHATAHGLCGHPTSLH